MARLERLGSTSSIGSHQIVVLNQQTLRAILGTHEAHLLEFAETADRTSRVENFDQLPCRKGWHTPWDGPPAVRSLAASSDGLTLYADIHVGSIMRSEDGGMTWEPVNPHLHEDVHQVATCPAAPDRVYANTANAIYVSEDCGRSWVHRNSGLKRRYGRAIAVHADHLDCLLVTGIEKGTSRSS